MELKLQKFQEGWDTEAADFVMPSARWDKETQQIVSWESVLERLTVFEAHALGVSEGKRYRASMERNLNG